MKASCDLTKLADAAAFAFVAVLAVAQPMRVDAEEAKAHSILVKTDAHEGPVVVPEQNRLYFTTKPDFQSDDVHIAIRYVDLDTLKVGTFLPRSNMANGMWLSADGKALLVAEQGTMHTPGAISRINLANGTRTVIVDSFEGKPFNSPNKVIESSKGWIYFSDPDYGANQGFKPAPRLPMAVYAHDPSTGKTSRLTTDVPRPHGLALSPDEAVLYIGDTDAIDGKQPYDFKKSHSILSAPLEAPNRLGPLTEVLSVPVGIPDGFVVTAPSGDFWVGAGDGLRHYSADGTFKTLYPAGGPVFNVTSHGNIVYSTADTAIWQTRIASD
ncbi:MAG: SMP-30/gluconolactonase/LRE family protein [Xanthobacteraceae bacterium]